MWDRLIAAGDMFDDNGALSEARAVTQAGYRLAYGQWLHHLAEEGVDLAAEAPQDRPSLDRLRRYATSIEHQSPHAQAGRFIRLLRVLAAAFPDGDWGKLRAAANALNRRAKEADALKLREPPPPSDQLLAAGLSMIDRVRGSDPLTKRGAVVWRDGLLIAFLACHAPRRRTVAALELGVNFRLMDDGYSVWARPEDMKAGRPFAFRASALLTGEIDAYIATARRMFPNGGDPAWGPLWLTGRGTALKPHTMTQKIGAATAAALDQRMTPHRFRHAATTTMVRARGFDARHAPDFLDHRRPGLDTRHYNLATDLDARRDFQELLETTYLRPARKKR